MSETLADSIGHGENTRRAQIADFREWCARLTDADLDPPEEMYRWSVANYRTFWRAFLDWTRLAWEGDAEVVCTSDDVERAVFFPDVRLNYAENLLRPLPDVSDESVAFSAVHGDGSTERLSRAALRHRVQATATALARQGVEAGDRVVVIGLNNAHAAVATLAVAALGGAVSTAMPDMGPSTLLGRFQQVEPAFLVLDRVGRPGWTGAPGDTLSVLLDGLPTVRRVFVIDDAALPDTRELPVARVDVEAEQIDGVPAPWPRMPFNAPLFVMFSSGTTGSPKAMVHGIGGTLLEHVKEQRLHNDTRSDDVYFHQSTVAWMVWNRHLSTLAGGAQVVVYDGPVRGPETLWRLVAEHGVTVFGTSPAYLQLCEDAGYRPVDEVDISRLRVVLSMGAILEQSQYEWFADAVGPQPLWSSSGGTDIIGAFVLPHPELPVERARISTRSLGMDVAAVDERGVEVIGEVGELVCRNPFPSRPVHFLRDPDGQRYHEAYFTQNPGMWTHGDRIEIGADGTSVMHGRSDGVLNIDGVRIGPTEIYSVLRGIPEIAGAMAVEQRTPGVAGQNRLVLLVVLREGVTLDSDLERRIRGVLREQASAAHVPSLILAVADLPHTHNGKPSERAARDALNGEPVANLSALRNPESLEAIRESLAQAPRPVRSATSPAPADRTTAAVARLWWDTLGAAGGGEGSFADLGGTSRQAMSLVRQIRVTLGRDLSIDTFLADPTLPGLTAAVRAAGRATDAPPVVPLAPGQPGLPPLFFVHDAWGDVDVYWAAAQLLTSTGPVYGVRTDLHRPDGARRSISELAAAHVPSIQRTAPTGPLRLAGHSFGGLVALESARLLTAAGREVDFLGLLDSRPPAPNLTALERFVALQGARVASVVPGLRDVSLGVHLRRRSGDYVPSPDEETFATSSRIYQSHAVQRWDGPLTYFRARRRVLGTQNLIRAWRRIAPGLTVVDIPGGHIDVLGQDNLVGTAERISRVLATAGRT